MVKLKKKKLYIICTPVGRFVSQNRCLCVLSHWFESDSLWPHGIPCSPPGSSIHGDSSGKKTGVGCHFLPQGIFLTLIWKDWTLVSCVGRWLLCHYDTCDASQTDTGYESRNCFTRLVELSKVNVSEIMREIDFSLSDNEITRKARGE